MFNSLNRRYIVASTFWIMYLLASAYVIYSNVNHMRVQHSNYQEERQLLLEINQALTFEIGELENSLQSYLVQPRDLDKNRIIESLNRLEKHLKNFTEKSKSKNNYDLAKNTHELREGLTRLNNEIIHLMQVRSEVESLFPASKILFQEMLPSHQKFYSAASIAIDESPMRSAKQRAIRDTIVHLRHNWVLMIGAFRVYIANRVGVFSIDSLEGLKTQKQNIMLYLEVVEQDVAKLEKMKLSFEQDIAFDEMKQAMNDWVTAFARASEIYESENWRSDLPILVGEIDPAKSKIWNALKSNKIYLDRLAKIEEQELSVGTSKIVYSYFVMVIIGIVLTILTYVGFDYLVRRPVSKISAGLLSEARGDKVDRIDETKIDEIDDLIRAFNAMTSANNLGNKKLNLIMNNVSDGVLIVDIEGTIESVNPGFEAIFGYKSKEIVGRNISVVVPERHRQAHRMYVEKLVHASHILGKNRQVLAQNKQGLEFYINLKLYEFENAGKAYFMGLFNKVRVEDRDISRDYDEIDALTNLYNAKFIKDRLKVKIGSEKNSNITSGILYCDIDDILMIELEYGQKQVEEILVSLADFFRNRLRKEDTIARTGYDEFVVLLDAEKETCIKIAEDIRKGVEDTAWKRNMKVTLSIGVLMIDDANGDDAEEVLNCAKEACVMAKKAGNNRIHVFNRNFIEKWEAN